MGARFQYTSAILLAATGAALPAKLPDLPPACDFYVSGAGGAQQHDAAVADAATFPSLLAAQSAVRAVINTADNQLKRDLVVCLGPGTHSVAGGAPLSFDASDSVHGGGRVVWRGIGNKAAPTIVTGGVQVTGWKKTATGFSAPVPAAASSLTTVRQLWVAGVRSNRTSMATSVNCSIGCTTPAASKGIDCAPSANPPHRCPPTAKFCKGFISNHKWGKCEHCECKSMNSLPTFTPWVSTGGKGAPTAVGFTTSSPLPASWAKSKPNTIEFAWPIVIRNWIEPRCTVASIVGNNVTLASPCALHLFNRHGGTPPAPGRIEAAPPAATGLSPGEFFHDTTDNTLHYQLAPGQTEAQLNAGAWIATKEAIVEHKGTVGQSWENLQFSYSTWMQPNSADGYVDSQATVYACTASSEGCNLGTTGEPLGAVRVSGGRDLTFSGCEFSHLGSAYALSVVDSSKRVSVTGSTFMDLSGGFLKLGSVGTDNTKTSSASWDEGFSVTHNVAHSQAIEYGGAPGYFGGFIAHSDISHNTVSDAGYSGFSQGWGWGGTHAIGYGNVTISYNRIFNVMAKMKDGGGIYVNGYTNDKYTNVMSHNWVDHDEHVFAVYYLDNGASHWHVSQNVATNSTNQWAFFMTPGTGIASNAAHNNTVDHLWYQGTSAPNNGCEKYGFIADNATIFEVPIGEVLPPPALAICAAAGAATTNPQCITALAGCWPQRDEPTSCKLCAGKQQHQLREAGCTEHDIQFYCGGESNA